jgi:predicted metal-dependent phosphotriesterase family hydrolase
VQTVLGPIAPADLGPTLMHEHLLCDIRHPSQRKPEDLGPELALDNVWAINYGTVKDAARNYLLDAREVAADEVARMIAAGGRSVVDLSSGGLSPDPLGLVAIARATGAHVVMGCGHYVHDYQDPANATRTVEDLAEEMVGRWRRRVGHRRAPGSRRDRVQRAVDGPRAAGHAGRGAGPTADRRRHQCAPGAASRPAAGGGRLHPREGRPD